MMWRRPSAPAATNALVSYRVAIPALIKLFTDAANKTPAKFWNSRKSKSTNAVLNAWPGPPYASEGDNASVAAQLRNADAWKNECPPYAGNAANRFKNGNVNDSYWKPGVAKIEKTSNRCAALAGARSLTTEYQKMKYLITGPENTDVSYDDLTYGWCSQKRNYDVAYLVGRGKADLNMLARRPGSAWWALQALVLPWNANGYNPKSARDFWSGKFDKVLGPLLPAFSTAFRDPQVEDNFFDWLRENTGSSPAGVYLAHSQNRGSDPRDEALLMDHLRRAVAAKIRGAATLAFALLSGAWAVVGSVSVVDARTPELTDRASLHVLKRIVDKGAVGEVVWGAKLEADDCDMNFG